MNATDVERNIPVHGVSDELFRLTQAQAEAIREGDLERLLQLLVRRGILMASLSTRTDRTLGETCRQQIVEMDKANEALLRSRRAQVVAELERLGRGQTGLGGYRAHTLSESTFIDRTS